MKIYVASSWRNQVQEYFVFNLKQLGHLVYDFKNPNGEKGFSWSDIDPDWKNWTTQQYLRALGTDRGKYGFIRDMDALKNCDVCILVLPCGKSAHLELGYAVGAGKKTLVYMPEAQEPELMYGMVDEIVETFEDVVAWVADQEKLLCAP